jgi:Ca2+-binding EF-hand superfamily protein
MLFLAFFQSFFAERFFAIFDTNGRGDIECGELMDGLRMLKFGTPTQKLKFLFDVFDVDGKFFLYYLI